tara:strand:- start:3870 stop:4361 length:492 start_codon:yes stop_codon:yes gene_type:complete
MKFILLITTLFFVFVFNAFSEEGSYEFSNVGSHNLAKVNTLDGTVTGGKLEGISIIMKSKGNLYQVGQNSETTCIILSKKESKSKNSVLEAFCESTDIETGDKTFTYNIRKEGTADTGSKGSGKQTIIGGTGKYKGISGECNYTVKYLPNNKLATVGTCDYKV